MSIIDSWVNDGHYLAAQATLSHLCTRFSPISKCPIRGTAAKWLRSHPSSCKDSLSSDLQSVVLFFSFSFFFTCPFIPVISRNCLLHFIIILLSLPELPISTSSCQTSTSRSPSWVPDVDMLMSKQVTIITRDLHRLTQNSSSSVTCPNASRYSGDSLSKSWSTSTVGKGTRSFSYMVGHEIKTAALMICNLILHCSVVRTLFKSATQPKEREHRRTTQNNF